MPGVTIQQLIEKWRQQIAPEIPMAVLLAFIEFESGGDFDNATHGKAYRDKRGVLHRSPDFYEIGLFQTPAGKYGQCSGTGELWHKHTWSCTYNPPGLEVPHNSSEWHKLCRNILADPRDWLNPVTQVRVGLQNLKDGANGRLRRHRHLFPTLGSDWYLRMAVLMPFAGGGGYTDGVLSKHATQLAMLPENRRWDFLRGKIKPDYEHNVDAKMALAARLGYRL